MTYAEEILKKSVVPIKDALTHVFLHLSKFDLLTDYLESIGVDTADALASVFLHPAIAYNKRDQKLVEIYILGITNPPNTLIETKHTYRVVSRAIKKINTYVDTPWVCEKGKDGKTAYIMVIQE